MSAEVQADEFARSVRVAIQVATAIAENNGASNSDRVAACDVLVRFAGIAVRS